MMREKVKFISQIQNIMEFFSTPVQTRTMLTYCA